MDLGEGKNKRLGHKRYHGALKLFQKKANKPKGVFLCFSNDCPLLILQALTGHWSIGQLSLHRATFSNAHVVAMTN